MITFTSGSSSTEGSIFPVAGRHASCEGKRTCVPAADSLSASPSVKKACCAGSARFGSYYGQNKDVVNGWKSLLYCLFFWLPECGLAGFVIRRQRGAQSLARSRSKGRRSLCEGTAKCSLAGVEKGRSWHGPARRQHPPTG